MPARLAVITAAAVSATMLVGVETAGACSCAFVSPKKQLKQADGAFNGRLLSVKPAEGTTEAAFRYRVGRVVKGPFRRGRVVTVWSENGGSICGLPQGTGDLYGLFVSREEGQWTGGLCGTVSPRKMRRVGRGAASSSSGCVGGG